VVVGVVSFGPLGVKASKWMMSRGTTKHTPPRATYLHYKDIPPRWWWPRRRIRFSNPGISSSLKKTPPSRTLSYPRRLLLYTLQCNVGRPSDWTELPFPLSPLCFVLDGIKCYSVLIHLLIFIKSQMNR
jgi:hypothetical protein